MSSFMLFSICATYCTLSRCIHVADYSVVWDCDPTSEFFPEAPKGALRPFSVAALPHYFLWCASDYFVVNRITCYNLYVSIIAVFKIKAHIHMNETILNSQKAKHSERRVESRSEKHPVTLP